MLHTACTAFPAGQEERGLTLCAEREQGKRLKIKWYLALSGFNTGCHTGGRDTGISPHLHRILKLTFFLILTSSLVANFQPFWNPKSHQKQPQSMYIFPDKFCMKPCNRLLSVLNPLLLSPSYLAVLLVFDGVWALANQQLKCLKVVDYSSPMHSSPP